MVLEFEVVAIVCLLLLHTTPCIVKDETSMSSKWIVFFSNDKALLVVALSFELIIECNFRVG